MQALSLMCLPALNFSLSNPMKTHFGRWRHQNANRRLSSPLTPSPDAMSWLTDSKSGDVAQAVRSLVWVNRMSLLDLMPGLCTHEKKHLRGLPKL